MNDLIANRDPDNLDSSNGFQSESDPCQRAWVEVYPNAIQENVRTIKERLADTCALMAVVKADGYGHGAETVSAAALKGGASSLGVATLQEGIELRHAGFQCPILLLANLTEAEELKSCLHWKLIPTLSSIREALICEKIAQDSGRRFEVQLKFDTGMTRLGCDLYETPSLIEAIFKLKNLKLKGIYSHLALADGEMHGRSQQITTLQQSRFEDVVNTLPIKAREDLCIHLANSAGTLRDKSFHYDMVRVGLAIYGYSPIEYLPQELNLRPALAVKARVCLIRDVPAGVGVSYGHGFITARESRLVVVAIGYADGVSRALSGKVTALFNGRTLPQVGTITMDQMVLDATDSPELSIGGVVTLLGEDGANQVTPKDWSDLTGSIPWEVLCGFRHRLPRLVI